MTRNSKKQSAFSFEGLESRTLRSASLLSDVNTGSGSSLPEDFHVVGNQVLFTAYDPARGQMLWSSNGTPADTVLIKDINPTPQNGTYQGYGGGSIVIGNEMYFTGVDSASGVELWKTNGTPDGTQMVADLNPGSDGSYPSGFTNFNGKLAFTAMGQLWISDGTSAGTISLGDYNPTGVDGTVDRMAVMGSSLYFMRYDPANSEGQSTGELWKTDGTVAGTQMVVDIDANTTDESVTPEASDLINVGGTLYFAANDNVHGWELWKSDGTEAGTNLVDDLAPSSSGTPQDGSYPSNLTDVNGSLYFTASADYSSPTLYNLNAANGQPAVVESIAYGGPSNPQQLTSTPWGLFFTADNGNGGTALWHTQGNAGSTIQLSDMNRSGNASISNLTAVGNFIYFTADDGTHGAELWTSDGSVEGTNLAADVQAGSDGSSPGPVTKFNNRLIFNADVDGTGEEPFYLMLAPPAAPAPHLAGPSATGISSDATPVVNGTAPAGSTVYLFADGNVIGSSVTSGAGDFLIASSIALDAGNHSLTVSDAVNGVSSDASTAMKFTVDTTPPTVSLLAATPTSMQLQFSESVAGSFGHADFSITNLDTGARIPPACVRVSFNAKTHVGTITFHGMTLRTGHYRIRIDATKITDLAGNDLSQNESFGFTLRKKPK